MGRTETAKRIIAAHLPFDTVRVITSRPDDVYIEASYNGSRTFFESVRLILDSGPAAFPPKTPAGG